MHSPDSVHTLDSHLKSLRDKKADLLRQLEQVNTDIAVAETKRARIKNGNASISKLPTELLSHIFLLCQKEFHAFQITASQVCNRWKDLSNGTPLLWADIRMSLEHTSHIPSRLQKLETYLTRSGPSSLFAARIHVKSNINFSSFLSLIADHIPRCAHLSLSVQRHPKACLLLREHLECLRAPQLDHLALHVDWADSGPYDRIMGIVPLIFKGGAPSLTSLQLSGIAGALRPPISNELTTLHLDGEYMLDLTVLKYREILAATPSLVNLSLGGLKIDSSATEMEERQTLKLSRLRTLRIRAKGTDHPFTSANALLTTLPLNQLENLILCDVDDLWLFDFPNVKDLSLYGCEFGVSQIGRLMLAFPSVVSLTLESASLLYMALSVEGEPIWWPNLRTLHVRDLAVHDVSMLLRLVQERTNMKHPLELVCFDTSSRRRASSILNTLQSLTHVSRISNYPEPWPPGGNVVLTEDDNFWDIYWYPFR
ncbi:hypothetical protein GGU10DRAFT_293866 [Lentinula aff. detonsa]|uniref:F-box domain-containing protein n=1 Tax=Lentinula aff. detonsa TaxID=2804958 RepID=A0AA38NLH5_9AGAR|nr:hypothetical protein GGU10DRAFT_293866 [Lentinula aff. detonsa]